MSPVSDFFFLRLVFFELFPAESSALVEPDFSERMSDLLCFLDDFFSDVEPSSAAELLLAEAAFFLDFFFFLFLLVAVVWSFDEFA